MFATVHDLFAEALRMKVHGKPSSKIREALISGGRELGDMQIIAERGGPQYALTFETGEKLSFDGTDYHYRE